MTPELRRSWDIYLGGYWTKKIPTKPGTYNLATAQGKLASESVVCYVEPESGQSRLHRNWGGYFWSEPLPMLPPVVGNTDEGTECQFLEAWRGQCREDTDGGRFCSRHKEYKCHCGAQAVKNCDETMGAFVCGASSCAAHSCPRHGR